MKWKTMLAGLAFGVFAAALFAQEASTVTVPLGAIRGTVVRYTPGQTIVVRSIDGKTVSYSIGSLPEPPAELQTGQWVLISTEPAPDGSGMPKVTRIEKTTSIDAQGQVKTTTERTETSPSGTVKSTNTTVYGTVTAVLPGQSITIERPGHEVVTYTLDAQSQLPQDLTVGKTVTVTTTTTTRESAQPIVRSVTYKTVTKTTHSKTVK